MNNTEMELFKSEPQVLIPQIAHTHYPPYRLGKSNKKAVLDANGKEVEVFKNPIVAMHFAKWLNRQEVCITIINQGYDY